MYVPEIHLRAIFSNTQHFVVYVHCIPSPCLWWFNGLLVLAEPQLSQMCTHRSTSTSMPKVHCNNVLCECQLAETKHRCRTRAGRVRSFPPCPAPRGAVRSRTPGTTSRSRPGRPGTAATGRWWLSYSLPMLPWEYPSYCGSDIAGGVDRGEVSPAKVPRTARRGRARSLAMWLGRHTLDPPDKTHQTTRGWAR